MKLTTREWVEVVLALVVIVILGGLWMLDNARFFERMEQHCQQEGKSFYFFEGTCA